LKKESRIGGSVLRRKDLIKEVRRKDQVVEVRKKDQVVEVKNMGQRKNGEMKTGEISEILEIISETSETILTGKI
jgi:hypothetical protein